jgi:hypothetical protein
VCEVVKAEGEEEGLAVKAKTGGRACGPGGRGQEEKREGGREEAASKLASRQRGRRQSGLRAAESEACGVVRWLPWLWLPRVRLSLRWPTLMQKMT